MELLTPDKIDWNSKSVIVRGDLDVAENDLSTSQRIAAVVRTVKHIVDNGAHYVVLVGYKGRPEGYDPELSLKNTADYIGEQIGMKHLFIDFNDLENYKNASVFDNQYKMYMIDNTRFWKGEQENSLEFAEHLTSLSNHFVNESFATAHREYASIVGIPQVMKSVHQEFEKKYGETEKGKPVFSVGFRFAEEIENLNKVMENSRKPVVLLISGVKEDKLKYVDIFKEKKWVDKVLVGGRLPDYMPEQLRSIKLTSDGEKVVVAGLNPDKEDITINSINRFEEEIKKAGTIVFAGPPGKYEDDGHRLGTQRVLEAIEASQAFKVAGGGDSEQAIKLLGKENAFDWISVGGGAMLEFLVNGNLPGLEALKK